MKIKPGAIVKLIDDTEMARVVMDCMQKDENIPAYERWRTKWGTYLDVLAVLTGEEAADLIGVEDLRQLRKKFEGEQ